VRGLLSRSSPDHGDPSRTRPKNHNHDIAAAWVGAKPHLSRRFVALRRDPIARYILAMSR
jgi:hypothetical protein